jgi:hypothetical protein
MRPTKQTPRVGTAEQHVHKIRRQTRKNYSSEEKIRTPPTDDRRPRQTSTLVFSRQVAG